MVIVKTEDRSSNNRQKTSPQSYKTQNKILTFPGLELSGSEHPEPWSYAFRLALIYILHSWGETCLTSPSFVVKQKFCSKIKAILQYRATY